MLATGTVTGVRRLVRTRRRAVGAVVAGAAVATAAAVLATSVPSDAVVLPPEHLVGTSGLAVDDAAVADPLPETGGVPEGVLALGATGRQVAWVQRVLGVPTTAYFGPATRTAVVAFQEASGASAGTGLVGPLTLAQLQTYDARQKAAAAKAAAAKAAAAKAAAAKAAAAKAAAAKAAAAKAAAAKRAQEAARSKRPAAPPTASGSGDPTRTTATRTSRSARQAVPLSVWVSSPHARYVADRESNFQCSAVSRSGLYRGKWQMSSTLWKGFGGLAYAPTADRASCAEQDKVAYRVWISQWWYPWGG